MSLLERFGLAGWQSKNGEKAVAKINDQRKLARIVREAAYWRTRIAAIEKLDEKQYQTLLSIVAKNDYYGDLRVSEAAFKKLIDEKILTDFVVNGEDLRLCELALKKVSDDFLLSEILKSKKSKNICIITIKKMDEKSNQSLFASIGCGRWFDRYGSVDDKELSMLVVVEKLTDQTLLADVAKKSHYSDVRQVAFEKLDGQHSQTVYADIAKNSIDVILGKASVNKLTEQEALADVAENAYILKVRIEAIKKLDIQHTFFVNNTKNIEKWGVCKEASQLCGIELSHQWGRCGCLWCNKETLDYRHDWRLDPGDGGRTSECRICGKRVYKPKYDD